MTGNWDKFRLLIWKNVVLQKRHKVQTAVEIFAPVIFATLMVLVRSLIEPECAPELKFEPFSAAKFFMPQNMSNSTFRSAFESPVIKLSYSPESEMTGKVIRKALKYLLAEQNPACIFIDCLSTINITGYTNASEMLRHLSDPIANDTSICGIQFDDTLHNMTQWPDDTTLTLRFPAQLRTMLPQTPYFDWKTNFLFPLFQTPGPRTPGDKTGGWPGYVREGFLQLAHAIFRTITNNKKPFYMPDLQIQRLPHPGYLRDDLLPALQGFISIIIMLSFNYTCINTVKVIAAEKERQLKEVMKIMGLSNWLHWTAWFIKTFSYIMITVIMIVILLKVEWYGTKDGLSGYSVFTYTPWHLILVFMMIYMATSICFCFMISVFFSKANTAATVAGMMWFLSYSPYMFLSNEWVLPSIGTRLASCLASNTAMAFGFEIFLDNEATAEGLQWSKLFTPTTADDPFVMGHILIMLIVDAFLYLAIALYVEQIFPGSYGVPQPWYFPVSKIYWQSIFRSTAVVGDIPNNEQTHSIDGIEPEPKGLKLGINIINLTKVFNKKTAVDKLNLKIYEDQITVLLGHNGAGKTTTMSMLTGMFPPTSGTAVVAGHDIRHDVAGVRASLGLCPQHNVLFSDLTVAEHIYFYSRLKGLSGQALKEEVDKYVSLLGLEDKRDVLSSSLSGGMQRRLSVGAALCGGSKAVLLDEPSSGMDPAARRHLWDLLHMEKKGRVIILTTHFMDEAEILGERVAVMAGGRLKACGSPFYLKRKFGAGYRLTAARRSYAIGAPAAPVTALLRTHIPQTKLYSDIGSELSYLLPEDLSHKFEPMLKELETNQEELGLIGFGISATTLEEVFMKVGADAVEVCDDQDQINYKENDANGHVIVENGVNTDFLEKSNIPDCSTVRYTGVKLTLDQWRAMLYKKVLVTTRSWLLTVLQLFIPVLFLLIAIMVSRMWQNSSDLPPKTLALVDGYENSVTMIGEQGTLSDKAMAIKKTYMKYFKDVDIPTMQLIDVGSESIEKHYLKKAENDMPTMRNKYLAAATLSNKSITVWFSNFAYHDLPSSFMLVHNAIIKSVSPNSSFTLINEPLPFTLQSKFELLSYGNSAGFQIAFNVGFSMAFVAAFYVLFYIKENVCRSKLLQLASGASPSILWSAAFVWDMISFIVISCALCITLAAFSQTAFSTPAEIGRVFVVLMVFAFGMLPLHFIAASFFRTPSTGFSRMCLFNIFTGVATFLVVEVLNAPGLGLEHIGNILHWVFLLFPNYGLCRSLRNLHTASVTLTSCNSLCEVLQVQNCTQLTLCDTYPSLSFCCISDHPYFEWDTPGIGANIAYSLVVGFVLFLVLLINEYKIINLIWRPWSAPPEPLKPAEEDSDVASERAHIAALERDQYNQYNLLCKDMSKYYGKLLAVNQLSIGVKESECFGLLGINGAGKTTTFKMLTGDLNISYGGAWVAGCSVNTDMKTVYKSIGYCPQFDALLDEMTGRETLQMFSRLRGIPPSRMDRYVWDLSRRLGFVKHLDKKVQEYSGGNKRKLSTALALLGDPQVVYLDEPTSGMDPMAKRQVWRAVSGRGCVVLTSHSMEECEALCSRIAIMVNGRPRCLGSTQHLKNKFSQGYTLTVKLKRFALMPTAADGSVRPDILNNPLSSRPGSFVNGTNGMGHYRTRSSFSTAHTMFDTNSVHQFLNEKFQGVELKESYQGLVTYYLPDTTIMWSKIFGVMEAAKNQLNIEDYSIGQTSLEQIFLQFTKDQVEHKDG